MTGYIGNIDTYSCTHDNVNGKCIKISIYSEANTFTDDVYIFEKTEANKKSLTLSAYTAYAQKFRIETSYTDTTNKFINYILTYDVGNQDITEDHDTDGIPDDWEISLTGSTIMMDASSDADNDNFTDLQEYQTQTNPFKGDTDNDGYLDGEDPDPLSFTFGKQLPDNICTYDVIYMKKDIYLGFDTPFISNCSTTFWTTGSIFTGGNFTIKNNHSVNFIAGEEIKLSPKSNIENWASFSASIDQKFKTSVNSELSDNPPVFYGTGEVFNIKQLDFFSTTITAIDPEGTNINMSVSGLPENAYFSEISSKTGQKTYELTWDTTLIDAGTYEIVFKAYDESSNSREEKIIINVSNFPLYPNLPPSYISASNKAMEITDKDDEVQKIDIGFNFTFYGNTHSVLHLSTNGLLIFGHNNSFSFPLNIKIPNTDDINNIIAPLWGDLNPTAGGDIYYGTVGNSPNRIFVAEWRNIKTYHDPKDNDLSFQVQLHEGSNNITFLYTDMIGNTGYANGSNSTVGIENSDGTQGILYSYNQQLIKSNMVIEFITDDNGKTFYLKTQ